MAKLTILREELKSKVNPSQAKLLMGFFKTGKGDYGEGDEFYGIKVPVTQEVAKKYSSELTLSEAEELLKSKIHEERLCALLILIQKFENKNATEEERKEIFDFYLANTKRINNWDLVDLSAHKIIGAWLYPLPEERKILEKMSHSKNLWEKRIAIISTFYFINKKSFEDSLMLAKILLHDEHDLMHKAVGWMLREIGKRDLKTEEDFLKKHYKKMPRTMLRYAIEKFPEEKRKDYLKGKV